MKLIELERPQRWQQPPWGMSQEWSLTISNSKTCSTCKQNLEITAFGSDRKNKDGLRNRCKPCNNLSALNHYYANAGSINKKNSERLKKAKEENPEKIRALSAMRQKSYRKSNPEKSKQSYAKWLLANPGANYKATKKWREANPHKVKEHNLRRRALRMSAKTYKVTPKDILKIMSMPCIYCNAKAAHLDHVIPLSRGGTHGVGNLAASCAKCNTSKNNKFVMEWKKLWS